MEKALAFAEKKQGHLREGFTTGTAASAAACAALLFGLSGQTPKNVRVPLPPFASPQVDQELLFFHRAWLKVAILSCQAELPSDLRAFCANKNFTKHLATAMVQKDAGDDPDVTHKAIIRVSLFVPRQDLNKIYQPKTNFALNSIEYLKSKAGVKKETALQITIQGGPGVGRITLPGLPLPVGSWAINPYPRAQIRAALLSYLTLNPCPSLSELLVLVTVPNGEELAKKTLNPRLGIVGGISILGTHGLVKPFSHEAFTATIAEQLSLAKALGLKRLFLATGRRSERLLQEFFQKRLGIPPTQEFSFIQIADHLSFTLEKTRQLDLTELIFGCFFGKLVKLSQGHLALHAHEQSLDLQKLARDCLSLGLTCAQKIAKATTAAAALEFILLDPQAHSILAELTRRAAILIQKQAQRPVEIFLFHMDGRLLATTYPKARQEVFGSVPNCRKIIQN